MGAVMAAQPSLKSLWDALNKSTDHAVASLIEAPKRGLKCFRHGMRILPRPARQSATPPRSCVRASPAKRHEYRDASQGYRSGRCQTGRLVCIGGIRKDRLLEVLSSSGIRLNALAFQLFHDPRFAVSPIRGRISIECVSVSGLGLSEGGTYDQVVAAAMKRGLVQCPLELGPQLRLAFTGQPEAGSGEPLTRNKAPRGSLTVASAPLDSDESTPKGFYLRRIEGTLWLRGYRSWPGHVWSADDEFVFAVERTPHADGAGR